MTQHLQSFPRVVAHANAIDQQHLHRIEQFRGVLYCGVCFLSFCNNRGFVAANNTKTPNVASVHFAPLRLTQGSWGKVMGERSKEDCLFQGIGELLARRIKADGRHASKRVQAQLGTNKSTADRILAGEPPAWAVPQLLRWLAPEEWAGLLETINTHIQEAANGEVVRDSGGGSTDGAGDRLLEAARGYSARAQNRLAAVRRASQEGTRSMKGFVFAGIASALLMVTSAASASTCDVVVEMKKAQAIAACRAGGYPVCIVARVEQGTWVAVPGARGSNPWALALGTNSTPRDQLFTGLLNACPKPALVRGAGLAGGASTWNEVLPTPSPALGQP